MKGAFTDCSFEPHAQVHSRKVNSSDDDCDDGDYDFKDEDQIGSEVEL